MENLLKFIPAQGGRSYRNPLPVCGPDGGKPLAKVLPDPYVLKHRGFYYAYATGEAGVSVLFSKDGIEWEHRGFAYRSDGYNNYWAPAVVYENGVFYMYVSSMPNEEEDVHAERLIVATSESPEGPFAYRKTLYDTFSLDAHVVKDEKGHYYLFYSNNEYAGVNADRPGTVILVDRLVDLLTPEDRPRLVVAPTIDEEIYEENRFGDGRDWHTIEGAFYLRRGGRHYVMYSGNAYVRPNYFLGYSSAAAEPRTPLTELSWRKVPADDCFRPLLAKNGGVEGVGHNSVIRGPNNVDDWVYYHGRNAEDELDFDREQRTMRTDPLLWCGDDMWVPGPSYTMQEAPRMPALRELFAGGEWLSAAWALSGDWTTVDGEVTQTARSGVTAAITERSFGCCVIEASAQWQYDHRGGLYGLYPCYVDADNYVLIQFDVGRRLLQAYAIRRGVKQGEVKKELPPSFRFDVYHHLRVEKTGHRYVIRLDGVPALTGAFPLTDGRVGLTTRYTSAAFSGIEITEHLALQADSADGFARYVAWVEGEGAAEVRKDELRCRSPRGRSAWLIEQGDGYSGDYRFDFDATMDARTAYIGSYAVYQDAGNAAEIRLDRKGNRVLMILVHGGKFQVIGSTPLPEDFDWSRSHTVSVDFREGRLLARLDRLLIYEGVIPLNGGCPGLICSGSVDFKFIRVTQLSTF